LGVTRSGCMIDVISVHLMTLPLLKELVPVWRVEDVPVFLTDRTNNPPRNVFEIPARRIAWMSDLAGTVTIASVEFVDHADEGERGHDQWIVVTVDELDDADDPNQRPPALQASRAVDRRGVKRPR